MSPLWAIALLIVGFVLRVHPPLVVIASALVAGALSQRAFLDILALIGSSFRSSRTLMVLVLALPLIALIEHEGLREWLKQRFAGRAGLTLKRVLLGYFSIRQLTAALGLTSVGGQAQSVRPLLVPLAEVANENQSGALVASARQKLRAFAAATDNVALFFGEDIFLAFGAILLIQSTLASHGIIVEPQHLAWWSIPAGVLAWLIHSARIARFQP
jgi:uncharacterized membrane protein